MTGQLFRRRSGESNSIVFCGGVYLAKKTLLSPPVCEHSECMQRAAIPLNAQPSEAGAR